MRKSIGALLGCVALAAGSQGTEFHVASNGSDFNSGTVDLPFRTIQKAAGLAQPGDTVTVHEGVYRERIDPPRGGTADTNRILYQAASGEAVVIRGSEPAASGWLHETNDTWKRVLPNTYFGLFNPFNVAITGDWFINNGRTHHPGSVYLNGRWLAEAADKATVLAPAGASPLWYAEVEGGGYLFNVAWLRPVTGPGPIGRINAPDYSTRHGVIAVASSEGGDCLGFIEDGDWACYGAVDFGTNTTQVEFRAASPAGGGVIELRAGTPDGALLGACTVANTGNWQTWQTFTATIPPTSGAQSLCLVFRSPQGASGSTTLRAQFKGIDPNTSDVEISARESVFYPSKPGINFITVRGFTLEHAATPWAPPTAEQIGLIGTHWSKGWIIENNTVRYSRCSGISLGKYGDKFDNTSANTAEGYVKTIERAHAHAIPWTKEYIGHHIVRNNHVSHCEQAGIVGSLGCAFSTVSGNEIHDIHVLRLFSGHEQAGIKFHGAIDTVIRSNHIYRANRGLWLDWMAQGTRVTGNLLHDNGPAADLYLEVNHGPFMVDNNVLLSPVNLLDVSEGGAYAHNLFVGKVDARPELKRDTPWHPAHSTTIAGLANIQGGESRFYNNVFVGAGLADAAAPRRSAGMGLEIYDRSARPLQTGGNVYLHGARPYLHDTNSLVLSEYDPELRLIQKQAKAVLHLNQGGWAGFAQTSPVTAASLGKVRIPSLGFENPDGTPLTVDEDYFGAKRSKMNPAPGPFAKPGEGPLTLEIGSFIQALRD